MTFTDFICIAFIASATSAARCCPAPGCPAPGSMATEIDAVYKGVSETELNKFRDTVDKAHGDKTTICHEFSNGTVRQQWCGAAAEAWANSQKVCQDSDCGAACENAKSTFVTDCATRVNKRVAEAVPACATALGVPQ